MLRRIIYEDWQLIFPVLALLTATAIYLSASWRALRMKPDRAEHMARMPLERE